MNCSLQVKHRIASFGGWTAPYWHDAIGATLGETFSKPFDLLLVNYERAGKVETGSFALEKPTQAELERRRKLT